MRWMALCLLLGGCTDTGWFGAEEDAYADAEIPAPLDDGAFEFCLDRTELTYRTVAWCDMVKELPDKTCPAMLEACEDMVFSVEAGGCGGEESDASGNGEIAGLPGNEEDPYRYLPQTDASGCDASESEFSLPGIRWVAAFLVALLVVFIFRWVAGSLGWLVEPVKIEEVEASVDVIEGDDDLPALPEEELLALAKAALQRGDLGEAVIYARGAALRRLARNGLLTLHRARTDREYLRSLRQQPETRGFLRTVLDAVEDHRWAGRELTELAATEAIAAATRILVVVLLMLPSMARAASDRYGTDGDVAVRTIIEELGYDVSTSVTDLEHIPDDVDILVLDTAGVKVSLDASKALRQWVRSGGLLLLVGKPAAGFAEVAVDYGLLDAVPVPRGAWKQSGLPTPRWRSGRQFITCTPSAEHVWVAPEGGEVVFSLLGDTGDTDTEPQIPEDCHPALIAGSPLGEGYIVRVMESSLLWNASFLDPVNRTWVERLFPWGVEQGWWTLPDTPRVLFAMRTLRAASDPIESMSEAKLLPFVLQLLAAWLLLALWRGVPFTPRRDPPEQGRLSFGEHVVALARHWQNLGARSHATAAYARLVLSRLSPAGLATAAMRHGYTEEQARALAQRAQQAVEHGTDDFALVEELWKTTRHR